MSFRPICLALLLVLAACGSNGPRLLSGQDFYVRRHPAGSPIPPLDRPGAIPLPDERAQTTPLPAAAPHIGTPFNAGDVPPISSIPTTGPSAALGSNKLLPTTLPELETDQYMTLGGVVMVVN